MYTITLEGEQQMRANVSSLLSQNQANHLTVRSWCSTSFKLLPTSETIACLNERIKALDTAIEHIKTHRIQHEKINKPDFLLALSDRALAHLCAEK